MICKNCGRTIRNDESYYRIKTEVALVSTTVTEKPEGEWAHPYCTDCGPPELRHLRSVNR